MGSAAGAKVRAANPADLSSIVRLCDALNDHAGLPTGLLDARKFRTALFGPRAFMFADLAEAGGEPIGYALSHDAFTSDTGERSMYLVDLFVEKHARRSGAGRALMAAVCRRARRRGAAQLWWASTPHNLGARNFYARIGATDEAVRVHSLHGAAFRRLAAPVNSR